MSELVSIITPVFNSEKYLDECICSVLNQTYLNWELIIIDDMSNDNSKSIINRYSKTDKRIKPFFLKDNVGAAMARNYAISKIEGKYLAFLDSDDIWFANKLELQINFMKLNNYSFVFSSYDVISEDGMKIISKIKVPKQISYNSYLKNTIIGCLTVVIDVTKHRSFKMPNLRSSHDMAAWLNLLRYDSYAFGLNQTLAQYRLVKSSNTSNKLKAIYDVWKVYRKYEGFSFFYSLYNFVFYIFNAIKKRL